MSGFIETFADFMNEVGWMVGIGLFLIFMGLLGYALLYVAGSENDKEGLNCEHDTDD